jgi:hypothetical protein
MIPIDEVVYFDVITRGTGGVVDADSAPTYDVFEESTDTPILDDQTMTKRTSLTGNYRGSFTASAANGFEAGKWYSVIATATVDAVTDKTVALLFRVAPAESSAGVPKIDVSHFGGSAGTFSSGRPEVNTSHWGGTAVGSTEVRANLINIAGRAVNTASAQLGVNVVNFGGSAGTFASGRPEVNTTHWMGTAAATPTVAGVPEVDITHVLGSGAAALTAADAPTNFSSLLINASGHISRVTLTDTATTLTNLPTIPANWITAAGIATDAIDADAIAASAVTEIGSGIGGALSGAQDTKLTQIHTIIQGQSRT